MESEAKPEIFNVTKSVVEIVLDEVLREEKLCSGDEICCCERCRMDVIALALNHLPPKYVVSQEGKAFELYRLQGLAQSRITVYEEILRAVHTVKARPHHNR